MTQAEKITALLKLVDLLMLAIQCNNKPDQNAILREAKEVRDTIN